MDSSTELFETDDSPPELFSSANEDFLVNDHENSAKREPIAEVIQEPGSKNETSQAQWEQVMERMKELEKHICELDSKMERTVEELESTSQEMKNTVEKQKNGVEQVENVSQTLFMCYQENSEEIRNLQLGFHEIGSKNLEKDKSIEEKLENIRQELSEKYEQINIDMQVKYEMINVGLKDEISMLEKEVHKLKGKQENVILDAMRSTLECMVCLELPRLPLFVCPSCSKMLGCFRCCRPLQTCANCRADLSANNQPLRGLEVLSLLLPSSDE